MPLKPATIPERERIGGIEALRLVVLLLVCLAVAVLFIAVRHLDQGINKNRETGYQTRATTCAVLEALRQPLPDPCLDPHVQKYLRR